LLDMPEPLTQPSSDHGAFRFNLVSLSSHSTISFRPLALMRAQFGAGVRGVDGVANKKSARLPEERLPAGAPVPGEPENAGDAPARTVQLQVQIQLVTEPRMTLGSATNVQLVEAVDELGHSLLPTASNDRKAAGQSGTTGFARGSTISVTARLHGMGTQGKFIKKLRGTVEVSVSGPLSNPLKIPLEGASGKTFQNDDRRVVVNSIGADPLNGHKMIVLSIADVEQLFPGEMVVSQGFGGAPVLKTPFRPRFGGETYHSPIRVFTSNGRSAFFQTSIDPESLRVSVSVTPIRQLGEPKEIRISSIVGTTAKVPFEFHDLPMP
jgi:hypothetical protein